MTTRLDIYKEIAVECAKAGTNISQVCSRIGVAEATVYKWKKQAPKSMRILKQIKDEIAAIAKENEEVRNDTV